MTCDYVVVETPTPKLLAFFNPYSSYITTINNCYSKLQTDFDIQVIGVTAFAKSGEFPVISDDQGNLARKYNVLDPTGGGVYPLDRMILLDEMENVVCEYAVSNGISKYSKLPQVEIETAIIDLVQTLNRWS